MKKMKKVYLIDFLYSGHHLEYSNELIRNTDGTKVIVNENCAHLFSTLEEERVVKLKCKDISNFKIKIIGLFVNFIFLWFLCKKERIEKIHFLYADNIIIPIYLFNFFSKKKIILTVHWARALINIDDSNSIIKRIYRKIKFSAFDKLMKMGSKVFVHGKYTANLITKNYGEDINLKTIPYGIVEVQGNVDRLIEKKEYDVLFFGGLRADKGIRKLAYLVENSPEYKFIIAGKPLCYTSKEIKKLFDYPNVELNLDYIPDEKIPEIFSSSKILILPYESYFSGQSGPMTLAAKYGIPMVASNVGDMGAEINHFNIGLTVEDNSPALLKAAIRQILPSIESYSDSLDSYYQRGKWSNVGQEIESYY